MEKRIYIRVPEQLLKEFDRACKANYTTKSEVLRRAMLEYVRETKKEDVKMARINCYVCDGDFSEGYWLEIQGEDPTFYCQKCAEEAGIIGGPGVYEHGPHTVVEVVVLETTETVESADGHRFQNFETVERFQLIIPVGDPKTAVRRAIDEVEARGYNVIPNDQGGCNEYFSVSGGEDYIAITVEPK